MTGDETTPLLPSHFSGISINSGSGSYEDLPPLDSVLSHFPPLRHASIEEFQADLPPHAWSPQKTAFWVLLLLTYPIPDPNSKPRTGTNWTLWRESQGHLADQARLEQLVATIWQQVLRPVDDGHANGHENVSRMTSMSERNGTDWLEDFLWTEVRTRSTGSERIRVVDALLRSSAGGYLLRQIPIFNVLQRRWNQGGTLSRSTTLNGLDLTGGRLKVYQPSPRVMHGVAFTIHCLYLAVFSSLLLFPRQYGENNTTSPANGNHYRAAIVGIYSFAFGVAQFPAGLSTLSHLIPSLAIASTYCMSKRNPNPEAGTTAHTFLLLSFVFQLLYLYFPTSTNPMPLSPILFFGSTKRPMFISVRLRRCIFKFILPTIMFCLPLAVAAFALLSLSLADPLHNPWNLDLKSYPTPEPPPHPTPYATRIALLNLTGLSLLMFPLVFLAEVLPVPTDDQEEMELDVKRTFLRAVIAYSRPFYYLPPFNVLLWMTLLSKRVFRQVQGRLRRVLMGAEGG